MLTADEVRFLAPGPLRAEGLDGLRGFAILAMVTDHLALFAGLEPIRNTLGRVAVPLFFLVAGHLSRRLSWRTAGIGLLGVLLPLVVPWLDAPNVLLYFALGAVLLAVLRRLRWSPWLLVVLGFTAFANPSVFGPYDGIGTGYPPLALFGLMAAGALIPREQLTRLGDRAPSWLRLVGRYPLSVYVGHTLAITLVTAAVN